MALRPDQIKPDKIRSDQIRPAQTRLDQIRSAQTLLKPADRLAGLGYAVRKVFQPTLVSVDEP